MIPSDVAAKIREQHHIPTAMGACMKRKAIPVRRNTGVCAMKAVPTGGGGFRGGVISWDTLVFTERGAIFPWRN